MSSENPESSTISEQDPITESLQYYNNLFNNLQQSDIAEVLQYLVTKQLFQVLHTKYDYYYKS